MELSIFNQNHIKKLIRNNIKILILIILGAVSGYSVVHFSFQSLLVFGSGLLLIAFVISPAKFLLFYLAVIPLIDQLIPLFASGESEVKIGPHIIIRGGLIILVN